VRGVQGALLCQGPAGRDPPPRELEPTAERGARPVPTSRNRSRWVRRWEGPLDPARIRESLGLPERGKSQRDRVGYALLNAGTEPWGQERAMDCWNEVKSQSPGAVFCREVGLL